MTDTTRCPGNELNKSLEIIRVDCPKCGKENEIFGDEVGKIQKCTGCKAELDLSQVSK